eukprot:14903531-Alexandrium_andersonii.AAC.1
MAEEGPAAHTQTGPRYLVSPRLISHSAASCNLLRQQAPLFFRETTAPGPPCSPPPARQK